MNARDVIAVILLVIGVGIAWLSCAGLLLMRNAYDRLHAVGPGSILSPIFITAAVLVQSGFSQAEIKTILIMLAAVLTSPIATHAIGRAARLRETGDSKSAK